MTRYLIDDATCTELASVIGHLSSAWIDEGYDEGAEKLDQLGDRMTADKVADDSVVLSRTDADQVLSVLGSLAREMAEHGLADLTDRYRDLMAKLAR